MAKSIKEDLCSALILTQLDFQKSFLVEMDASLIRVGVVLSEEGQPIKFFTQKLSVLRKKIDYLWAGVVCDHLYS